MKYGSLNDWNSQQYYTNSSTWWERKRKQHNDALKVVGTQLLIDFVFIERFERQLSFP